MTSVRLRRLELASARQCGVGRGALVAQLTVETAVWAGVALVISLSVLTVWTSGQTADLAQMLLICGRGPVAAALGSMAGAAVATALVRERDIFRYFKER